MKPSLQWLCRDRRLTLDGPPLIMGIVNVTPDSFSDGGRLGGASAAVAYARLLAEAGADILDIGGESTRPGARPVDANEERRRVLPVIEGLAGRTAAAISVDTTKASVAQAALRAGAHIVNEVSACTMDAEMAAVVRDAGAGVVLMHMRGNPRTMQADPRYADVVSEVRDYLARRIEALGKAGVPVEAMAVDPGIGFGKTTAHNLALLARLDAFAALGRPVVVGHSRKRFIGELTGRAPDERLAGSLAAAAAAVLKGAHVLRAHDVAQTRDAARVAAAIAAAGAGER